MLIRPAIPAEEFVEKLTLRKYFRKFLQLNLHWLSKFFGARILLELPENLQKLDPSLYQIANLASKLKMLGIIKRIWRSEKDADEPFQHVRIAEFQGEYGGGSDFFSEENAFWKCIAETTERHLWFNSNEFYKYNLRKSSFQDVEEKALNIFKIAGFSEEQKINNPCLAIKAEDVFGWTNASAILDNKKILCPVQLVSRRYFNENVQTPNRTNMPEKLLRRCITTGLATGHSLEEAKVKGVLEVMERDAYMITYLNKISPPLIELENISEQDPEIAQIIKNFKRYELDVYILELPTDFPVKIFFALLIDRTGLGPALSAGAKADFDSKSGILGALSESLAVRYLIKNKFRKTKNSKKKNYKEERHIFWSKSEHLSKIDFLTNGREKKIDLGAEKTLFLTNDSRSRKKYYSEKLDMLDKSLKRLKYESCYVELTTPEIKNLGLRSVQVVIPELQPMHLDESMPYYGGKRLKDVPLKLGYKPAEKLNEYQHPFL